MYSMLCTWSLVVVPKLEQIIIDKSVYHINHEVNLMNSDINLVGPWLSGTVHSNINGGHARLEKGLHPTDQTVKSLDTHEVSDCTYPNGLILGTDGYADNHSPDPHLGFLRHVKLLSDLLDIDTQDHTSRTSGNNPLDTSVLNTNNPQLYKS